MSKPSLAEALGQRGKTAFLKHRDDPPMLEGIGRDDTTVEQFLPLDEITAQWTRLAKIGILPVRLEHILGVTEVRVVYVVPPDIRLN